MKAPAAHKYHWRFSAIAGMVTLLVLMAVLTDERVGSTLGILVLKPHFMDWAAILAAGDAHTAGADVYAVPNPFDPLGRPHVYGPWWLLVGNLGVTVADRWWSGALISASFVIAAVLVLAPRSRVTLACSIGLLISPPIMLGLERANNDLIVFLFLVAAAWMLARWPRFGLWATAAVVTFVAALKLYPLAALAALPSARVSRRTIITTAIVAFCACFAIACWYLSDYVRAIAVVPKLVTIFTYGVRVFIGLIKGTYSDVTPVVVGIAVSVAIGGWAFGRQLDHLYRLVPLYGGTAFGYVAGSACWVFCYFVNTNLPYRTVLLLLPARLWMSQWEHPSFRYVCRRCAGLALVFFWTACATGNVYGLMERNREEAEPFLLAIVSFEQTTALILTTVLLISLFGWAIRHCINSGLAFNVGPKASERR